MTFPNHDSEIITNEAGEPMGWSAPEDPVWCDRCGCFHGGDCDDLLDLSD